MHFDDVGSAGETREALCGHTHLANIAISPVGGVWGTRHESKLNVLITKKSSENLFLHKNVCTREHTY